MRELRPFLNLKDDRDWVLVQVWLVAALRPAWPFVIMILYGEQGSAKTTAQRLLRALIDPNKAPLRSAPRSEQDLAIAGRNGWCLAYDNLSWVPRWLSDALCRVATGGGFATRRLYTDDEEEIFEGKRPILLNGIENVATSGDLLDRSVLLFLQTIEEEDRRDEEEFWAAFRDAHPRILGALLDALSTALRNLPDVKLDRVPRMADFTKLGIAAEPALDCQPGDFLAAYRENRDSVHEDALEASVLAKEFVAFVGSLGSPWEGTATQLFEELNEDLDDKVRRQKGWPKTPAVLGGMLRRLAPSLRGVGIGIEFRQDPGKGSRKLIRLWPQNTDATDAADATDASASARVGGVDDLQTQSGDPDADSGDDGTVEGTV